jgi:hypothetical protein
LHTAAIIILLILTGITQPPQVLLATDQPAYAPGDSVTVIIQIQGFLNGAELWIYVDEPNLVNFNSTWFDAAANSAFTWIISLPENAQQGKWVVTATWEHRQAQTSFIVTSQQGAIPEFPLTFLVLIVACATATCTLHWRKAGSGSKAVATNPRALCLR